VSSDTEPVSAKEEPVLGPELPPVSYAEAEAAFLAGEDEKAVALFSRYAADRPENVWGRYMLGISLRRTGDLQKAEEAFRSVLDDDADHLKSLVNLGRVLIDADRPAEALPWLEHAVEVDPASVDGHRVLARALHSLGRREEALATYDLALGIDSTDAWSLNNSGLVLIEEERFEEAVERLERACAAEKGVACFHNNLGIARERSGDRPGATRAYAAALAIDESYEKARISLARVESLGEPAATDPGAELATESVTEPAAETEAIAIAAPEEETVPPNVEP
jgi:predicted Zn-dependent protease